MLGVVCWSSLLLLWFSWDHLNEVVICFVLLSIAYRLVVLFFPVVLNSGVQNSANNIRSIRSNHWHLIMMWIPIISHDHNRYRNQYTLLFRIKLKCDFCVACKTWSVLSQCVCLLTFCIQSDDHLEFLPNDNFCKKSKAKQSIENSQINALTTLNWQLLWP